jgi:N-methylhydantoinase A
MSAREVAVATRRIVVSQMADLIRQMTIERGMDPREFALYAYGGAGGLHVAAYMHELGCGHAVIPLGTLSTTWSAYGCATSDLLQIYERSLRMRSPIDMDVVNAAFDELEAGARRDLEADGIPAGRQVMERSVEIKYPLQIHQLDVAIAAADTAEDLVSRFVGRYEQLYGIGSAWDEATVEMVGCRVVARGSLLQPMSTAVDTAANGGEAIERPVVWIDDDGAAEEILTPVVGPDAMPPAAALAGPLIIESETTTVVVPPTASAVVTPHGDLMLQPVHGSASSAPNVGGARSVGAQAY